METRAYKLNREKRPAEKQGTFLYYFYDNHKLTSIALPEEQFDRLVALDRETYNSGRRENAHRAKETEFSDKQETIDDVDDEIDEQTAVSTLSDENRTVYELCIEAGYTQTEVAKILHKTQSYVAKRLAKIKDTLSSKESFPERQWDKFLHTFRTDDDEDVLLDAFHYAMNPEILVEIVQWFYSYKEYYKFCLTYLILRPYSNGDEKARRID